jgi:hypothetical protein
VIALLLLFAADTPLSAILIEGEGWKEAVGKPPAANYRVLKAVGGRSMIMLLINDGRMRGEPPIAVAGEGEVFGSAAISPDGGLVVIGVPSHHFLYAFRLDDSKLTAKEKCYALRPEKAKGGSDVGTLTFDSKGRLFAAMPEGVQFFDEEMRFSGQLSRPERRPVTHVWFDGAELYIRCGDKTWKRKVKATGP